MQNSLKYLITILLTIIGIVAIYVYFNTDYFISDNQTKSTQLPKDLPVISENKPDNEIKSDLELISENEPKEYSIYYVAAIKGICKETLEEFNLNLNRWYEKSDFEEKQKLAKENLISLCSGYYEFNDSLSESEKIKLKSDIKSQEELRGYFSNRNPVEKSSLIKDARSFMATGGDGSDFSREVLSYLLKNDNRFLRAIAKELNISQVHYIKQNASRIADLYMCEINYEESCSPDSIVMLTTCAHFGMCDMSYSQFIATTTTANNFTDILYMIDIIKKFIRQGYFD